MAQTEIPVVEEMKRRALRHSTSGKDGREKDTDTRSGLVIQKGSVKSSLASREIALRRVGLRRQIAASTRR